ncbi:MAG: phytoene synthase [Flavobacteriales bacterium]|nr:MAG: phytoene synthase [Flavobacteriales bacterium]
MKALFDTSSNKITKLITRKYSTSFSMAVLLLGKQIRPHIYNIYGFVRLADEIVDSFHDYDKEALMADFEADYYKAISRGISLNPVLNAFQDTVRKFNIDDELIQAFLSSMKRDLEQCDYNTYEDYKAYIYGSADVVGLMCLKVFVNGDQEQYEALKPYAEKLGSAFQKVNFLRDIKADTQELKRCYFPNLSDNTLTHETKQEIIADIEHDFDTALKGIKKLPINSKAGVYTAYVYYSKLLEKLKRAPYQDIMNKRIRVSNPVKLGLIARSFATVKLNIL